MKKIIKKYRLIILLLVLLWLLLLMSYLFTEAMKVQNLS